MYTHCRKQYNRFSFRISVLGTQLDAGESFATPEEAAVAADLAKHYLASEYRMVLPPSLDGEQFSSLAYSRRGVDLSSSWSVEKSLSPAVRTFISEHKAELEAYKQTQPVETMAGKLRRSWNFSNQPEVREWVEKVELAELQAEAFSALNQTYFFSLLDASSARLTDVLKPLKLAIRMHAGVTDSALVARADTLSALVLHLEQNLEYVRALCEALRAEEFNVKSAVATLEAARPVLS